jgi:hypothetical protein
LSGIPRKCAPHHDQGHDVVAGRGSLVLACELGGEARHEPPSMAVTSRTAGEPAFDEVGLESGTQHSCGTSNRAAVVVIGDGDAVRA